MTGTGAGLLLVAIVFYIRLQTDIVHGLIMYYREVVTDFVGSMMPLVVDAWLL